jgi:hypothetical protein
MSTARIQTLEPDVGRRSPTPEPEAPWTPGAPSATPVAEEVEALNK